jgi:integrase
VHGQGGIGAQFLTSGKGRSGKLAMLPQEVGKLLAVLDTVESEALFKLEFFTGIRREDIVAIEIANIDWVSRHITFWESKKRRNFCVWFDDGVKQALQKQVNAKVIPLQSKFLFPSPRNSKKHMTGRYAYKLLQMYLDRAGVKRRPFHALRASCVKILQKAGWSIDANGRQFPRYKRALRLAQR